MPSWAVLEKKPFDGVEFYRQGCPWCGGSSKEVQSREEWSPPEGFHPRLVKVKCRICQQYFYQVKEESNAGNQSQAG